MKKLLLTLVAMFLIMSLMGCEAEREDVLNAMHQMANTKVIADTKWGEVKITDKKVNGLITIVESSDFEDKHILLFILYKWKEGNFSRADWDHNYVWEQLGGTIGRATGVKE